MPRLHPDDERRRSDDIRMEATTDVISGIQSPRSQEPNRLFGNGCAGLEQPDRLDICLRAVIRELLLHQGGAHRRHADVRRADGQDAC